MAVTVYGVPGSLNDAQWAEYGEAQGLLNSVDGVVSGLKVTVGSGVRTSSVALGTALSPGALSKVTGSAGSVAHAANTGTNPRIDTVCLQVSRAAAAAAYTAAGGSSNVAAAGAAAAAAAGSLVAVKGTNASSPVAPTLTRVAAGLWQIPLRDVLVRPNVTGQFASSDLGRVYSTTATSSDWVTFSPSVASGWTVQSARYRFVGPLPFLEVKATRTGSTLTAGSNGNLSDTGILDPGSLPSVILPADDVPLNLSRRFFMSGTAIARANGALVVTDAYPNSDITGANVIVSGFIPLG